MPYTNKRKRTWKSRKQPLKRRKVAANVLVPSLSKQAWDPERIFRFKRRQNDTFIMVMNTTAQNTYKGIEFQLDKTEQYAEISALFDQYRITAIKVDILPRFNVYDIQGATSTFTHVPFLLVAVDLDDAATPTDYRDVISKESCRVIDPYKPYSFTFRPKIALSAYGNAGFGQYATGEASQWINAASDDVEYYGIKMCMMPYSASNNDTNPPAWDLLYTYYIECRYPQ